MLNHTIGICQRQYQAKCLVSCWTSGTKGVGVFKLLLSYCSRSGAFWCPCSSNRSLLTSKIAAFLIKNKAIIYQFGVCLSGGTAVSLLIINEFKKIKWNNLANHSSRLLTHQLNSNVIHQNP
ncbi:hypothetical protein BAZSYMB_GCONTIG00718_0 [Bathymodiolus azoricus thioautotrophic gill symbiont]|uniref:Uncharacterized protein n=1 Tax=Bathymodiolus azoricus thioautotrophic gill symbiont TaxID=235205 RepID=A0A1H6LBX3_9GAMM|nr:hypothetical protein BAZSYMB_GCONTIG00718_0 [Bathymodiolus azoricus thioautotrophic gill symbiont]